MKSYKLNSIKNLFILNTSVLGGMFILNRAISEKAVSGNLLKTDHGTYFDWKHGRVFYTVRGKGEVPLVLLHDANVLSSAYEWHNCAGKIGSKYHIYIC